MKLSNNAEKELEETIRRPLRETYRSAWSVVWRITAIPALVFIAGLTILMLVEREPKVVAATPIEAAKHLAAGDFGYAKEK